MSFSCDQAGARINAGADTVVAVTKVVTAAVEAVVVAATEVTYCLFRTFDNSYSTTRKRVHVHYLLLESGSYG